MNSIQEVQFLLYLISIILGCQLTFYIFYQYYKIRDPNLQIDKILLSLGFILLLTIVGAFVLFINRFFVSDPILKELVYKIGYGPILFVPFAFLYIISGEKFSNFNFRFSKYFMVLSLIPLIMSIFVSTLTSPLFLYSIIFSLLGAVYIAIFQVRLIRVSVGNIKNKLIIIFLSEILIFLSIILSSENTTRFYPSNYGDVLFFIGTASLTIGFTIMLFAAYNFPSYLEFKWMDNLNYLCIINTDKNICLYSYDFTKRVEKPSHRIENESEIGHDNIEYLFSGGIIGIDTIIAAVTNTQNEKINIIKHGDSFILLEQGTNFPQITYALVVNKELKIIRYFLNSLKNQFESFYKEILLSLKDIKENEKLLFSSFDVIINNFLK